MNTGQKSVKLLNAIISLLIALLCLNAFAQSDRERAVVLANELVARIKSDRLSPTAISWATRQLDSAVETLKRDSDRYWLQPNDLSCVISDYSQVGEPLVSAAFSNFYGRLNPTPQIVPGTKGTLAQCQRRINGARFFLGNPYVCAGISQREGAPGRIIATFPSRFDELSLIEMGLFADEIQCQKSLDAAVLSKEDGYFHFCENVYDESKSRKFAISTYWLISKREVTPKPRKFFDTFDQCVAEVSSMPATSH